MEGNAFTDFIGGIRRIFIGYTDEEKAVLIEEGKRLKERQEKGQTTTVGDAVGIVSKRIMKSEGMNTDMIIGLFVFLLLVMIFKR
jgi:hypothetical protein